VDENNMTVKVPTFRDDVEREADIAEEIARFYGYNNIEARFCPARLPHREERLQADY